MSDEFETPSGHGAAVTSLPFDDPHLQEPVRHPRRTEAVIGIAFLIGLLAFALFGAVYVQNWPAWTYGLTLGIGMLSVGFGMAAWGKYLMPQGPFVEPRESHESSEQERQAALASIVDRGGVAIKRRKVLGGLLGGGLGIFGIVALFPLLRSLGPLPGKTLLRTNWRKGSLLVDVNGRPVHRDDLQVGGIMTVFPAGFENNTQDQAVDQTVLIRAQTGNLVTRPGRETWAPEGYVAYSKVCTHAGCPVGLYEQQLKLLVCPCHQSMFNVVGGAWPVFGPAPRPLPQLPLYFDENGYLHSQTGYDQAIGPSYYERE